MIGRTIGVLGFLLGILALSSLIYGFFTEPFEPYLRGVVGETLEKYQHFRDLVFAWLGGVSSTLINWLGSFRWLSFLPPAPWFQIDAAMKDVATLVSLILTSVVRGMTDARWASVSERFKQQAREGTTNVYLRLIYGFESGLAATVILLLRFAVLTSVGTLIFFLMAYGEAQLGF